MECGFLSLTISELAIALEKLPAKDLTVRLDVEILNGYDVFKWVNNGDSKLSTSIYKPMLQPQEQVDDSVTANVYICGFNDLMLRTTFIDLNSEVMNGLANSKLVLRVVYVNENPEPVVPVKAAKGVPPPVAVPAEETYVQISIPLYGVLQAHGAALSASLSSFPDLAAGGLISVSSHSNVILDRSSLAFDCSADNCLAEHVLACKVLRWESAAMQHPPASWSLHAADVVEPKAKVQPTPADLRARYLDNVGKLVDAQAKVAAFSLTVGGESSSSAAPSGDDVEAPVSDSEAARAVQQMVPLKALSAGTIAFDRTAAAEMPIEDDIRAKTELWSVSWGPSDVVFLHRSEARQLVALIQADASCAYVPLTVKKTPAPEYVVAEGGEQFATGLADLSSLVGADVRSADISVDLQGGDFGAQEAQPACSFTLRLSCVGPLVPKSALQSLIERSDARGTARFSPSLHPDLLADKQVSAVDPNTDAVGALRDEIRAVIERVAQEYVSLYPIAESAGTESSRPTGGEVASGAEQKSSQEGRKLEFLSYLSSNGIFHDLRQRLKHSVQQIIRDRCGARGRAAGRSASLAELDLADTRCDPAAAAGEDTVESVLSELYVFLMRECNLVLNALFSETVVDRLAVSLERSVQVNDEEETNAQRLRRMSAQADDAAADSRVEAAEAMHLECIHFVSSSASLGSSQQVVHEVHARYAEFLLTTAATAISPANDVSGTDNDVLQKAREALSTAVAANRNDWRVALLHAGVLIECGQQEQGESALHVVLEAQLGGKYTMRSFVDFDGYDSDELRYAHPLCYSVLAALFSMQDHALRCRKALRLVDRSFAEGQHEPHVSTHGSPKRTVVLALADAANFLFQHSLRVLGAECVKLASDCEAAVSAKAVARGKAAATVPHIRHLLKLSQANAELWCGRGAENAAELAQESEMVADAPTDQIQGLLCAARSYTSLGDSGRATEAYLRAMQLLNDVGPATLQMDCRSILPLHAVISVGKLLINAGRHAEALSILLFCCSLYSSAALFLLVGTCYLRLEQLADAEEALAASNVLDNRNPNTWAFLCLLCLAHGNSRVEEADRCLAQALRLGLSSSVLLRELATAHIALDKLQAAEDLVRRALARETREFHSSGKRPNAHTRRLLGDVLAGQNQAVGAIEAYQAVIAAEEGGPLSADRQARLEAAEKCAALLASIGRDEELRTLRSIIAALSAEGGLVAIGAQ